MQKNSARRTNRERSETTRAALISAARRLFVTKGYSETGTPEIVSAAGVTRGALYHHFADKPALFRAVVEQEAAAVAVEIEQATPESLTPQEALLRGGQAFMKAMAVRGRTRLLLLDGPAILGRGEMDAIDREHGARTLREGLSAAMAAGAIPALPLDATTTLLAACFDRAALAVEAGGRPEDYRRAMEALIDGLLSHR